MSTLLKTKVLNPVILFLFSLLSYGIFIPFFGLYSDDWVFLNAFQKFGHAGLTQYYQTNRPILGLLFQITMPIVGKSIYGWHIFAFIALFLCALAIRKLILTLWPTEEFLSLLGGVFFIVYPGFTLLPISITFGHTYLIFLSFILSTIFVIKAYQNQQKRLIFTLLSIFFTSINLFMMEYFFTLTFIQPIILFYLSYDKTKSFFIRIGNTLKFYFPWILTIILAAVWRIFIFKFQTYNYRLNNVSAIKTNFFSGMAAIAKSIVVDIFKTGIFVWVEPIKNVIENENQISIFLVTIAYIILGIFVSIFIFRIYQKNRAATSIAKQGIPFALLLLALAGWPFWITGLEVKLNGLYSRFTLPFILGSVLLLVASLSLLKNRRVIISISAVLIGLALGKQFISMNEFRQEYVVLTSYMNQLFTRVPNLKLGSFIISNDLPFPHFSDATLTAIIDWFYSPQASSDELDHVLVFSKDNFNDFYNGDYHYSNVNFYFSSQLGKSVSTATIFDYNTDQLGLNSCLTTLNETNILLYSLHIPPESAELSSYSNNDNISYDSEKATEELVNYYFPTQDKNNWCIFYQHISKLEDEGKYSQIDDQYIDRIKPTYYLEMLPFLNAFYQTEDWQSYRNLATTMFTNKPDEACVLIKDSIQKKPYLINTPEFQELINKFNCTDN